MTLLSNDTASWWRAYGLVCCTSVLTVLVAALTTVATLPTESPGTRAPSLNALSVRLTDDFAVTRPLPQSLALDVDKVALGARLFHDQRLSDDDSVSCASCHPLSAGGMDGLHRSVGVRGGEGGINAPTVFNSGLNFAQFWDGRAPSLEAQIEGPVNHPLEMASNWMQVLSKLGRDTDFTRDFRRIYAEGMTVTTIKDAIATFERSLVTPDSRFDRFLRGDAQAVTEDEKAGYALFQSYGCSSCHQGVNLGGNMYEKMGLMGDYFADRGNPKPEDLGRFNQTKNPENMHEFRVPSLRNVALTAPYFHDGSAQTLEQAIEVMVKYQLGRPMEPAEVHSIAAFLRSLTGTYQGRPL
jgi:cytochrome c peroxidase